MAKLPSAESLGERPTPRPDLGVVSYRPVSGQEGAVAQAVGRVGAQLSAVGDELYSVQKKEQERIDRALADDALNQLGASEDELTFGKDGFRNRKGGDAVKKPIIPEYVGKFTESANLIKQTLKTDRQKELFDLGAKSNLSRLRGNAYRHVDHEADVFYKATFANTKERALSEIASNWNNDLSVANSINKFNDAADREADRLGLPELRDQERRAFLDSAIKTQVEAQRMVDPVGALSTFQKNSAKMTPHARQTVGEAIFRDAAPVLAAQVVAGPLRTLATNDAEAQALVRVADAQGMQITVEVSPEKVAASTNAFDRLPGDQKLKVLGLAHTLAAQGMAQHREALNYRVQDSLEALERGQMSPNVPSLDELTSAYGPERGARVAQTLGVARQFGEDVARVATMSLSEMGDLMNARQPQPGPGFAIEQKRQDELRGAIGRVLQEREKDPAAFALQYAPSVKDAYGEMVSQPSPQASQAFAVAMLSEQKRLGIAEPALLPKPMADQLSRQFSDLSEGAQKPAQLIQAQANTWGQFWPQVYKQIAKDISPTARVVANLRDTPAAALLSQSAKLKTEELKKGVLTEDQKTINDQVDSSLAPFRRSLIGWTSGGTGTYNDFEEATKRLAYIYAGQDTKPVDAAKRAARELVEEYYDFRGSVRIPRAVDASGAERGMAAVLKASDALGVRVPEGEAKVLGPEFVGKTLATSVKNSGFFVTLGDDSGVALYLQGANGARAIEGANGRPITFTWRELQDRAIEARRQPGAVSFGETDAGAVTGATRAKPVKLVGEE